MTAAPALERIDAAAADYETALLSALCNDAKRTHELIGGLPLDRVELVGPYRVALNLALTAPPADLNLITLRAHLIERGQPDAAAALIVGDDMTLPTVKGSGHAARELIRLQAERLKYRAGQHLVEGRSASANELLSEARLLDASCDGTTKKIGPAMLCCGDVERKRIRWLWRNRIAIGKLNLLAGDPGGGKTHVAIDIAARVSTGGAWPDGGTAPRGDVLLMSAEDDPEDTIRPRLEAAGADLSRCHMLQGRYVEEKDHPEGITLQSLTTIDAALAALPDARLLIVDPVSAYYGSVDCNNTADVRALLAPLQELCARRGVALLVIVHPNKSTQQRAMYRIAGALGLTAAARIAWLVAEDEEQPGRRTLTAIKSNIGPMNQGLAFRLEPWADDPDYFRTVWEDGVVELSADEVMNPTEDDKAVIRDLDRTIMQELASGPVEAERMTLMLRQAGYNDRAVRRAKKRLGIISEKARGALVGKWVWKLPSNEEGPRDLYCTSSAMFGNSSKNTEGGQPASKVAEEVRGEEGGLVQGEVRI